MASRFTGNGGVPVAFRTNTELVWYPRYGWTSRETWQGPYTPVLSLYTSFALAGYRTSVTNRGALYILTVDLGTPPDEVPLDRWGIDMERAEVSIWRAAAVYSAMNTVATAQSISMAEVRKNIEDSVSKGLAPAPFITADTTLVEVWRYLLRGGVAYEVKRPVISRQRTYSIAYTTRIKIDQIEKVYTTAALARVFFVPAIIRAQLPDDPASPPDGTAWAWKTTIDQSDEVPALYKVQENKQWVFDAWSTTFYSLVT